MHIFVNGRMKGKISLIVSSVLEEKIVIWILLVNDFIRVSIVLNLRISLSVIIVLIVKTVATVWDVLG